MVGGSGNARGTVCQERIDPARRERSASHRRRLTREGLGRQFSRPAADPPLSPGPVDSRRFEKARWADLRKFRGIPSTGASAVRQVSLRQRHARHRIPVIRTPSRQSGQTRTAPVRGKTCHRLWIKPHLEASHGTARGSDLTVIRNSGQPRASTRVCYERPDQVVYRYLCRWRQTRVWNRQLLKPVPDRPGAFVGHVPVQ